MKARDTRWLPETICLIVKELNVCAPHPLSKLIITDNDFLESGNMVIMAYAHAQRSRDTSLLNDHVRDYNSRIPHYLTGLHISVRFVEELD